MDVTGIAAMGMAMSESRIEQSMSISLAKKTMDSQEQQAAALLDMMPPSPYQFDVYA